MQVSSNVPHSEAAAGKASDANVIRVLIADDHPVVCLGLLGIINGQSDMTVVGQAKTGIEAVVLARKHSPDVILIQQRVAKMSGVVAPAALLAERPESADIVVSPLQADEDKLFL